jgi:nucleoside-diphosphate-sugar epimerase
MPLTIAITGSNGMVGLGVTAKALEDGHRVIALDISQDPHPSMAVSPGRAEGEDWAEGRDGERRGEGRGEGRGEEAGARGGGGGKYKYYQLDATDYEAYLKIIKEEGVNAIIHLAATFNRFGQDGEYLTNVHSHVSWLGCGRYHRDDGSDWGTVWDND